MIKTTAQKDATAKVADALEKLMAARERVAALESSDFIDELQRLMQEALAEGDEAGAAEAAHKIASAQAGTDGRGAQAIVARAQVGRLEASLHEAEMVLAEVERKALVALKERLHSATVKAFGEYAELVDVVTERYIRLSLVANEYYRVEAQVRGAPQVNFLVVDGCVTITPPGGAVPCLNSDDQKKRFIREVALTQPPAWEIGVTRPWAGREIVEKIRAEVEGI